MNGRENFKDMMHVFFILLINFYCIQTSFPNELILNQEHLSGIQKNSIVQVGSDTLYINFSFFSWDDFFINSYYDPYGNSRKDCGCTEETKLIWKKTMKPYTGVVIITEDREDRKIIILEKQEYTNGLRSGEWLNYQYVHWAAKSFICKETKYKNGELHGEINGYLFSNESEIFLSYTANYEYGFQKGRFANYYDGRMIDEGEIIESQYKTECHSGGQIFIYDKFGILEPRNESIIHKDFVRKYGVITGEVEYEEYWENKKLIYVKQWIENTYCNSAKLIVTFLEFKYEKNGDISRIEKEYLPYESDCKSYLTKKTEHLNGKRNGFYFSYFDPIKKRLSEKGEYVNDKMTGVWETYNENGNIKSKTSYINGNKNGIEEVYDENGSLFRKLRYEDGKVVELMDDITPYYINENGNTLITQNKEDSEDQNSSNQEELNGLKGNVSDELTNREGSGSFILDRPNSQGKVVIIVCVDKNGNVISSETRYTQGGSTTSDSSLIAIAMKNANQWKFKTSDLDRQCGKITYNFELKY